MKRNDREFMRAQRMCLYSSLMAASLVVLILIGIVVGIN
jgi:hypothetical protein